MNRTALAVLLLVGFFVAPASATAFCGFYVAGGDAKLFNDASQVVLMRDGEKTVMSMQNNYEGPPSDFAMVVPVPVVLEEENVKTLSPALFAKIDRQTAPRLVEYWEVDPCQEQYQRPGVRRRPKKKSSRKLRSAGGGAAEPLVVIEAEFEVAEYNVVVLSAKESTALETWLRQEKYNIPAGAEPYFKPYIESGQYFFVAKVDAKKVKYENGRAVLSPLRFAFESKEFRLPIRLGMINSKGTQDTIVYVLAKGQRYEVANYPNLPIPTNIELRPDAKENFGDFYKTLFSRVSEENPKAVVTEYSWDASTCDPCPGPTLTYQDLMSLGADEITSKGSGKQAKRRPRRRGRRLGGGGWVVTRLHSRFAKEQVGEDLIFAAAKPIVGGREIENEDGDLEKGTTASSVNNFQGRYIIRHEWKGKVECENPIHGRWGGPPTGGKPTASSQPSPNTTGESGTAKGKKVELEKLVKTGIALLKVRAAEPAMAPAAAPPATGTKGAKHGAGIDVPTGGPAFDDRQKVGAKEAKKEGAPGCSTASSRGSSVGLLLMGLVLLRVRSRRGVRASLNK